MRLKFWNTLRWHFWLNIPNFFGTASSNWQRSASHFWHWSFVANHLMDFLLVVTRASRWAFIWQLSRGFFYCSSSKVIFRLVNFNKGAGTQIQWLKVMAKMVWWRNAALFIAFPFFPYLDNTLCILVLQRCVNFTRVHFECPGLANHFFKYGQQAKIPILLKDLKVFQITPCYLDTL